MTPPDARGWVVSPAFDLLFLANVGWVLLLVPGVATRHDTPVEFWQVYFLTLPHRWMTLVLVAADRDRRDGQARKLQAVAVLAGLVVVAAYFGTGAFVCLAVIDYVWNAWHFGSQHAGVLRLYGKKVGGGSAWLERHGVRLFVTYAAVRAAGWTTGMTAPHEPWLRATDLAVLAIPAALLLTNLAGLKRERTGKLAYLLSMCVLYAGFVLSIRAGNPRLVLAFAGAGAMFHAVEYLAVVTHYAWRRGTAGSDGAFRAVARYWVLFLGAYLVLLGAAGAFLSRPDSGLVVAWQGLNLWASFVHYAYDGMIWKLRRPETAAALGVGPPAP